MSFPARSSGIGGSGRMSTANMPFPSSVSQLKLKSEQKAKLPRSLTKYKKGTKTELSTRGAAGVNPRVKKLRTHAKAKEIKKRRGTILPKISSFARTGTHSHKTIFERVKKKLRAEMTASMPLHDGSNREEKDCTCFASQRTLRATADTTTRYAARSQQKVASMLSEREAAERTRIAVRWSKRFDCMADLAPPPVDNDADGKFIQACSHANAPTGEYAFW
eukprot:gene3243-32014_t